MNFAFITVKFYLCIIIYYCFFFEMGASMWFLFSVLCVVCVVCVVCVWVACIWHVHKAGFCRSFHNHDTRLSRCAPLKRNLRFEP